LSAEPVHFIYRISTNVVSGFWAILGRKEGMLTEMLCENAKEGLSVRSWAEDVEGVS
jgi:hypothetical protein